MELVDLESLNILLELLKTHRVHTYSDDKISVEFYPPASLASDEEEYEAEVNWEGIQILNDD